MRDLNDFNKLEEGTWKKEQALNGIDENSKKTQPDIKKNPMPLKCRLCLSGKIKLYCVICNVMDYEH